MAVKEFLGWVERRAQNLRGILSLKPRSPLDPYALAVALRTIVLSLEDLEGLSPEDSHQLMVVDAKSWSAGSIQLPCGQVVILLNPTHAETRKRATLMEELAHIYLQHTPSQLITISGIGVRSFKRTQETQAYWVGAAALIPLAMLQYSQANQEPRIEVARQCGVSTALVSFREKVTGIRLP